MTSYAEKLRDPRWQKKRLEIMNRDGFRCQRCQSTSKPLNIHHKNGYRRKTNPWDYPDSDLVTLCEPCHHGHHTNPVAVGFYLAGKISKSDWRHSVITELRGSAQYGSDTVFGNFLMEKAIDQRHTYCGPFFVCCDHGCGHGPDSHGCKNPDCSDVDPRNTGQVSAFHNCISQITRCDVFFAWIDAGDCYGTISEIGFAYGLNKEIYIGMPSELKDFWFCTYMSHTSPLIYPSPQEALRRCVEVVNQRLDSV